MQILKLTDEAFGTILTNMLKRSPDSYPEQEAVVSVILEDVRENGDKAVFNYTKKFDGADISAENFIVTEEEEKEAYEKVDPALIGRGRDGPGSESDTAVPGRCLCSGR